MTFPQSDPGDEQPALFDSAKTLAPRCTYCNTTRKNLCRIDAHIAHGLMFSSANRPKTCLNRHDPATAQVPY